MIKSIIFDWSGVLSNDWEATFKTVNDILEEMGHARLSEQEFRKRYQLPWSNFYKSLDLEVDEELERKRWERLCPKYAHLIKPLPHAKKTLEWAKEKGIKTIIFSSHNQRLLEREIINFGFSGLIGNVSASHNDKRHKIEELVKHHEIEKKSTLYAGDMCHDIETAHLAGIKSVAVLSGYNSKEKLEKEKPDFIINEVGELPALVERIGAK